MPARTRPARTAPSSTVPSRARGDERMLLLRIGLALGLALLLVLSAWSTAHGRADAHSALCLAPGAAASVSGHHSADATVADATVADASVVETLPAGTGTAAVAALCCILLVLLVQRFGRAVRLLVRSRGLAATAPPRAGPRRQVPALTLTQLSLSRI